MGYHNSHEIDPVAKYPDIQPIPQKILDIHNSNTIKISDTSNPHFELSNLFPSAPIIVNNIIYRSAEHYYQSQKFTDQTIQSRVMNAPTPNMAAQIAINYNFLSIPNFDKRKAMLSSLRAKFSQISYLGDILLDTKDRPLILHSMYDNYWADGGDGSGKNIFGELLMQVRTELQNGIISYANPFIG